MRVAKVRITSFRGVSSGVVELDGNTLLVGSNSVGKSTVCEALDLVLGPERMFRRPVVDEYDFFGANYQPTEGGQPLIEIEVVLVDLGTAAERRFGGHLRKWSPETLDFADQDPAGLAAADALPWCLPVLFHGRFDAAEDDFEGNTFFSHPDPGSDDLTPETSQLGGGRSLFLREDKRFCGYLYLRTNRTGTRALSFHRGSLLDTIVRLEDTEHSQLWEMARSSLEAMDLENGSKLDTVIDQLQARVGRFMALQDDGIQAHPTDLTRETIREALRLFVVAAPGTHAVPFNRLSTGSLNLLVFALLTYIAELKGDAQVIFAMEEPEIALPPHAQRRLVDFVIERMGQAIITSHSPYVIERFEPEAILMLSRDDAGTLTSEPLQLAGAMKPKKFREERRQFAEAILGRAVIVVEGGTEATVLPVIADVLDADKSVTYTHLDLAGASIFDAKSDVSVPPLAPLFKGLGKRCYGLHDTPDQPLAAELQEHAKQFDVYLQIPYKSIEELLLAEMPASPKRSFLTVAAFRDDYPGYLGFVEDDSTDEEVHALLKRVLKERKGPYYGYAALLVTEATGVADLPKTLVDFLLAVDNDLGAAVLPGGLLDHQGSTPGDAAEEAQGDEQSGDGTEAAQSLDDMTPVKPAPPATPTPPTPPAAPTTPPHELPGFGD